MGLGGFGWLLGKKDLAHLWINAFGPVCEAPDKIDQSKAMDAFFDD